MRTNRVIQRGSSSHGAIGRDAPHLSMRFHIPTSRCVCPGGTIPQRAPGQGNYRGQGGITLWGNYPISHMCILCFHNVYA